MYGASCTRPPTAHGETVQIVERLGAELVHFMLGQGTELSFLVPLVRQIPQVGLWPRCGERFYRKRQTDNALHISIRDIPHLLITNL